MVDAIRRARLGVFGVFWLSGVTVALWVAALPAVNHRLDLGEGRIGTVLLATGAGALVGMPIAGRCCDRWTSRHVLWLVGPASSVGLVGPALAPSYPALLAATFVFGAGAGALDVSMNAHAVEVEHRYGRPVMSAFHGVWSLGGVAGGAAIAGGLFMGADVRVVMSVGALLSMVLFVLPARLLLRRPRQVALDVADADADQATPIPRRVVLLLGVVALAAFICEGAAVDWAALHAHRVLDADLATASLAYSVFAVSMTAVRLVGDRIRARFGSMWTIQRGGFIASTGYLVVLLAPLLPVGRIPCAYAGWVLVGLGLATVVPVVFASAGAAGAGAGRALSRVTTFGYVGMLAGPAVIGPIAELTSLGTAMALPAVLTIVVAVLGPIAVGRTHEPVRRLPAVAAA